MFSCTEFPPWCAPCLQSFKNPDTRIDFCLDSSKDPEEVLTTFSKHTLRRGDMLCLRPHEWIADETINAYLCYLGVVVGNQTSVGFFTTFAYVVLAADPNWSEARSMWTDHFPQHIFEYDKVVFPVFTEEEKHWSLAIIHPKQKRLEYLDSLHHDRPDVLDNIAHYYENELSWNHGCTISLHNWERVYRKDIRKQRDGTSCGVHILKYCKCLMERKPIEFSLTEIPISRREIGLSLFDIDARRPETHPKTLSEVSKKMTQRKL